MDTYDQFRESERRTFWLRVSAAMVAIGASAAIPGAAYPLWGAAIVAVLAAASIVAVKLVLLPRFRSDAWIYGQLGADGLLAAGMLAVFGPLTPALAWPTFSVAYYSLFLGRNGAVVSAGSGVSAVALASGFHTGAIPTALLISLAAFGGVAAVTSLIASDRFKERARRTEVEHLLAHEARSSRVLAGLTRMSNARGDREIATALADAVRTVSHFPAAVSFVTRPSDGALVPIAWRLDSGDQPATRQAVELPESETPAALSGRQGAALVLDDPDDLPGWASELGFKSGIVLPICRGMEILGAVYGLDRRGSFLGVAEIEQLELTAAFASRMLSGSGSGAAPSPGMLDSILNRRGNEPAVAQRPVNLPGLRLDPGREHAEIGGMAVSLSKTEFALLYTLAGQPGETFDAGLLARTCWEGEAPNDNAVDVTVYRLRRKLARVPMGQDLIQTVRGRGYVLQVPVQAAEAPAV